VSKFTTYRFYLTPSRLIIQFTSASMMREINVQPNVTTIITCNVNLTRVILEIFKEMQRNYCNTVCFFYYLISSIHFPFFLLVSDIFNSVSLQFFRHDKLPELFASSFLLVPISCSSDIIERKETINSHDFMRENNPPPSSKFNFKRSCFVKCSLRAVIIDSLKL